MRERSQRLERVTQPKARRKNGRSREGGTGEDTEEAACQGQASAADDSKQTTHERT